MNFFTMFKKAAGPSANGLPDAVAPGGTRDLCIDSFRGLALVIMTLDHIRGSIRGYSYQLFGFVTAAELFIFLSGLVAGMVYTRRMQTHSFPEVRTLCWKRAGLLYLYHIITFAAVVAVASAYDPLEDSWRSWIPHFENAMLFDERGRALGLAALLLYQPTHLDILPMYALFLLLLPGALWLLERRGAWAVLVIAVALWGVAQTGISIRLADDILKPLDLRRAYFDVVAWQCLFWFGLVCGRERVVPGRVPWLSGLVRRGWLPALVLAVAMLLLRHDIISTRWALTYFDLRAGTRIDSLGWFRLLNFLCLALGVAGLACWKPRWFQWRWFSLLGQHSLQVYTAHIALVFLMSPIWAPMRKKSMAYELFWTAVALLLLTATARGHQAWQQYRRKRRMGD